MLFGVFGVIGVFGVRGVERGLMLEKLDAEHLFVPSRAWRTPSPLGLIFRFNFYIYHSY